MNQARKPNVPARGVPASWLPAIGAGVMVVLFVSYYLLLASPEPLGTSLARVLNEQHKVLWGSSSLVLNVVMLWCLGIGFVVSKTYSDSPRERIVMVIVVIIFTAVTAFLTLQPGFVGGTASDAVLGRLFALEPGVKRIVDANNVVGAPVVLALVFASVMVSRRVQECTADELGDRIRWFATLLYSVGALLATATYQFFRLYAWGAVVPFGSAGVHAGFASSLALSSGLILSCFMALVFLPTAVRLNIRLDGIVGDAASADPAFDRERWDLRHRIGRSPLKALGSYVAVLLPTAMGMLTKLLGV